MPSKNRPDPIIPDHEILRKIGGGAYGEVWLGRGVTGALRAVKVVWREDFDDARGFEREFEGILKFEPISRDHPGLVHILHVGRSPDGTSFYYYVMELGDDVRAGQDINAIEYEPRTLRADTKQAVNPQLDTPTCIDVGLRLAEALDHLHERGLAHRDVKPSNVIFLNGRAKLADIGLVAARDQRTFVGTEGFVPPEGPGSAQADVYSLGKVLYEIATGKDRLDFPELPDVLPAGPDRKRWLELNKIICDICEPRLSKRMITTAADLADALRRLQRGKRGRRRRNGVAVWMTTFVLLGFTGWAGYETWKSQDWRVLWGGPPPAPVVAEKMGMVQIISSPQGADVIDQDGVKVGTTPTRMIEAKMGQTVRFELKKPGYQSKTLEVKIPPDATEEKPLLLQEKLLVFEPPKLMEVWEDHLGARYQPRDKEHVSEGYVTESAWKSSLPVTKWDKGQVEFLKFSENGKPVEIVLATKEAAVAYCDWLRVGALAEGRLEKHHEVVPSLEQSFQDPKMSEKARKDGLRPFHVIVREINYGMIRLVTNPPGARVYINGEDRGMTHGKPVLIGEVKPGKVDVYLVLNGHKPKQVTKMVIPGEALELNVKLDPNDGVVFDKEWQNGLGMKFVPMGKGDRTLMVSAWETRVSDYNRFIAATGYPSPRTPEFSQADDSPVVNVRREDAIAFCKWLTEFERKKERISKWHEYRLPTDMEWSQMAELDEQEGLGPLWRDTQKAKSFPWGDAWPPPPGSGNFADSTAALAPGILLEKTIRGYTDEHAYTAPVGTFPANSLGIHDLSGNVEEWVSDNYDSTSGSDLGVLRGGGWATYEQDRLYTGSRNPQPVTYPDSMYGFRAVLWKIPTPEPELVPSPLDVTPSSTPPTPIPPDNG